MDADTLALLARLAPSLMDAMRERAMALSLIAALQPIGRRALAQKLGLPEREVRALCGAMKRDGLIDAGASGMALTTAALALAEPARELSRRALDLVAIERALAALLRADEVAVAGGDADVQRGEVLREVGRLAAERVARLVRGGMTLAVSGGGTVAAVAAALPSGQRGDVTVLPARGGMVGGVEVQADTLAAEFARRLGGRYALLHLPDAIPPAALEELMRLPEVRDPLTALQSADLLIHGIGRADVMALRRNLPPSEVAELQSRGAAAEAMGAYFDRQGAILRRASGIGFWGERQSDDTAIVAVAAGASKAEAILAVSRHHRHRLIVTDEGAARAMLALESASI
ncbi:MAG: hypothetical protein GX558_10780 [Clostridiales bacterium]|nr:hypothetical protein [Clostridiales bacterium]